MHEVIQKTGSTVADVAMGASVSAAGWTWLAHTNEILQLVATVVAIVAGGSAAYFHITKAKLMLKEKEDND
jgi:hypothetical protein